MIKFARPPLIRKNTEDAFCVLRTPHCQMDDITWRLRKEKARVLYDSRNRLKAHALAPEEKAHIGF